MLLLRPLLHSPFWIQTLRAMCTEPICSSLWTVNCENQLFDSAVQKRRNKITLAAAPGTYGFLFGAWRLTHCTRVDRMSYFVFVFLQQTVKWEASIILLRSLLNRLSCEPQSHPQRISTVPPPRTPQAVRSSRTSSAKFKRAPLPLHVCEKHTERFPWAATLNACGRL